LQRLPKETSPAALFRQPPIVRFAAKSRLCSCGQKLIVQKTRCKTVLSLTGPFIAHETISQCPQCHSVFDSELLRRIVPSRCTIGYDVMVFVGQALFQRHRTTGEVQAELAERNVFISASEVHYLGRKFIFLTAQAHRRATPRIREAMTLAGGYILHIDAMHEGGSPALMSGMDSLSQIVLANVKVSSENTENSSRFLQNLKEQYGTPIACVHDMGKGICNAVNDVFAGVRDYICHFHFLRDIGKDFLEPAYQVLRNCLQHHGISSRLNEIARQARKELSEQADESALMANAFKSETLPQNTALLPQSSVYMIALWVLQGKQTGNGYGFPFDRPLLEFAQRILAADCQLAQIRKYCDPEKSNPLFAKLSKHASKIRKDRRFSMAIEELHWRSRIFDRLRRAMRIALPNGDSGLNDEGSPEAMTTIRQGVTYFRQKIEQDPKVNSDPLIKKMLLQIDKYEDKLFADPIEVTTPPGGLTIYPQRTNNILERFFRSMRRDHRRKTGNNSMRRRLQAMLADTPLIKNLDNPEYMEILLDGKTNLEELFAEIDTVSAHDTKSSNDNSARMLPGYQALVKQTNLLEKLVGAFFKAPADAKSN